jgi:hypothetical protein
VVQKAEGEGEEEGKGEEGQERPTMRQSKTWHLCFSLLYILVTLLTQLWFFFIQNASASGRATQTRGTRAAFGRLATLLGFNAWYAAHC